MAATNKSIRVVAIGESNATQDQIVNTLEGSAQADFQLVDVIVPNYTISRYLADMCEGRNPLALSAAIKGEARIFSFVAREQDEGTVKDMDLPDGCRVMFLYRKDKFIFADAETSLQKGDEVVIVSRKKVLPKLQERWAPVENGKQG